MYSAKTKTFATNSLFGTFFLSILGWGMLHVWALQIGARGFAHVFIAAPSLALCGILLFRYSHHWPTQQFGQEGKSRQFLDYRSLTWYVVLIAAGIAMALLMQECSIFVLVLAGVGLTIVPWVRVSVCRDHFFTSALAIGAGAVIGLILSGKPPHPLHYPPGAWALLSVSGAMTLFVIMVHGNKMDRMPASGY